jgi:hypothetical protein
MLAIAHGLATFIELSIKVFFTHDTGVNVFVSQSNIFPIVSEERKTPVSTGYH